jgi:TnpA family transposase
MRVRSPQLWGEGTSGVASDSKQFGTWDQNLMTEWHARYRKNGVMIYWHVDKKALCIHSQLKTPSSSEVASMIEGVLRHCTDAEVTKNYVDSHGQSEVGFAFSHLLGFDLLPRLKGIGQQKLFLPNADDTYSNLNPVLRRPISWTMITRQYDQMIKYATALRLGTAQTEQILRRFTRANYVHPTYRALAETGKALKTIFLCDYLTSEALRREINSALQVVEQWNSVNGFILYGQGGDITSNNRDRQEVTMLCLHLIQACLVYINTLMIQQVATSGDWPNLLTLADRRGVTPLIYSHMTPYGLFEMDLDQRIPFGLAA